MFLVRVINMNKKHIKEGKRKNIVLSLIFSSLFIVLAIYIFSNNLKKTSIINQSMTYESYRNDVEGYSLEYPKSYSFKESKTFDGTQLFINKGETWDDDGYKLVKGVSIIVENKSNISDFEEYVNDDVKPSFNSTRDGKIIRDRINGNDVLIATYAYHPSTNIPAVTRTYINKGNKVVDISFTIGRDVTKDEYEIYMNDYKKILTSVMFIN